MGQYKYHWYSRKLWLRENFSCRRDCGFFEFTLGRHPVSAIFLRPHFDFVGLRQKNRSLKL